MTVRRIRKYPADILRRRSKEITDFGKKTHTLFEDLEETLYRTGGLGLAAPQIGISLRAFIAFDRENQKLFKIINPEIEFVSPETEIDMEGCLSFPEIFFSISRPKTIVVKGLTVSGKKIRVEVSDILARCFLHEIEHLDGILIIDHASTKEKEYWKEKLGQLTTNLKK